ncbi:MAG: nucleotide exchange factor GrpE [Rhodospirillales bacterium]
MTAEDDKKPFGEETPAGEKEEKTDAPQEPGETPAPENAASGAAAGDESAVKPEAQLEAEVADLKDKLLRALAETENVRRRAARDKDDANKYAIASFAREMIEVRDNLRRALDAVDETVRGQSEAIKTLIEGIEMTERSLLAAFERVGIRPVEALRKKFDHNVHEALFEVEDTSVPAGTVVQELQPGYMIHDRLLRPAKVGVAKGGAKEAPADKEQTHESKDDAPKDDAATPSSKAYEQSGGASGGKIDEKL